MWYLLIANTTFAYTRADTLRGSNGSGRNWWDVQRYDLRVSFDTAAKRINGTNTITLLVTAQPNDSLQIDLQEPMILDKVLWHGEPLQFVKEGNVWWVKNSFGVLKAGDTSALELIYHGSPRIAKNPPWDGGFIWTTDSIGNPWLSVACQGLGASVWWPCKDIQSDEPDNGMSISLNVPQGLQAISNGRLSGTPVKEPNNTSTWNWQVKNPINTYDVSFYIGDYIYWTDTMKGEKGLLDLGFYVLRYNELKARQQFAITKQMLHCFEKWLGPYPFYEDGYKLVEAPFLGMEHQSAIAYGNKYQMGYMGRDRSNTGVGLTFDFIIVHETGHEWFGNNITAKDIADNWIHEGFTTYTEALFAECLLGKEKAYEYTRGEWRNILNNIPVIGPYGVQGHGSGDMYDKGSAVVHMIRVLMDDDNKFRTLLRGMNKQFYHSFVSSAEIEEYINKQSGIDFTPLFDQYLRTTDVPELEYYIKDGQLFYKFNNVVKGLTLPLTVTDGERKSTIKPTGNWQYIKWKGGYNLSFSKDFYINVKS